MCMDIHVSVFYNKETGEKKSFEKWNDYKFSCYFIIVLLPFGQCKKVCVLHDWSETFRIFFYNLFFQTSDEERRVRKS